MSGDIELITSHLQVVDGCAGRTKHAARNAISHLVKAYEIYEIDPLMAMFRSICAEEEAATALICSLQDQGYQGAGKIKFHDHSHKHAVIILVKSVVDWYEEISSVGEFPFGEPRMHFVDVDGRRGIELAMPLKGSEYEVQPRPPLHLLVNGQRMLSEEFADKVFSILGRDNFSKVRDEIKKLANTRNKILYASPSGRPSASSGSFNFMQEQLNKVGALLVALGLIDPWRKPKYAHAGIVVSSIDVLLKIMQIIKDDSPPATAG